VSDAGVQARRLLRRQPLGVAGAVVVLGLVIAAIFAPVLAPHGPKDTAFGSSCRPGASSRWAPTIWGATC
jgi:peptide/nickel transport system permease protein